MPRELSLERSSALISTLQGLGMVLALALELMLAASFGLGIQADAYFLALAVPLFFQEVASAAIPQVLMPHFGQLLAWGRDDVTVRVAVGYGLALAAMCTLLAALFYFISPWVFELVASTEVAVLARGFLPPLLGVACLSPFTYSFRSLLNVRRRFLVANGDWALTVGVALVFFVLAMPLMGVAALAWGQLLGTGMFVALASGSILSSGTSGSGSVGIEEQERLSRLQQDVAGRPRDVARLLAESLLPAAAAILSSLTMLVGRLSVAVVGPGAVAALGYAYRVRSSLERLLLIGIGTAGLSEAVRLRTRENEYVAAISQALSLAFFVGAPVAALLIANSFRVMELIYVRGAFGAEDATLASRILPWYGAGLAVSAVGRTVQLLLVSQGRLAALLGTRLLSAGAEILTLLSTLTVAGIAAPGIGWLLGSAVGLAASSAFTRRFSLRVFNLSWPSLMRSGVASLVALALGVAGFWLLPEGSAGTLAAALLCLGGYWASAYLSGSREAKALLMELSQLRPGP